MYDAVDLRNDGTLTSFQAHVPSLASGTIEELDRVIQLFLDVIPRVTEGNKSATRALAILRNEGSHDIHFYFPRTTCNVALLMTRHGM